MTNVQWVVVGQLVCWRDASGNLLVAPITNPSIAAWLAAGGVPTPADPVEPIPGDPPGQGMIRIVYSPSGGSGGSAVTGFCFGVVVS